MLFDRYATKMALGLASPASRLLKNDSEKVPFLLLLLASSDSGIASSFPVENAPRLFICT